MQSTFQPVVTHRHRFARLPAIELRGLPPEQVEALAQIMARLVTEPDVVAVYDGIVEGARSLLAADTCAVFRRDPASDCIEAVASEGLSGDFLQAIRDECSQYSPAGELKDLEMIVIEDVDDGFGIPPLLARIRSAGSRAAIIAPMMLDGRLTGALSVGYDTPRAITDADRHLVSLFATLAAAAAENSRVHSENNKRAERLRVINEVSLAIASTLDVGHVCETVYEQVGRVLCRDAFYVGLYDEERDEIRHEFTADRGCIAPRKPAAKVGDGPSGWVIRNRAPYILTPENAHIQNGGGTFGTGEVSRSAIHVPMMLGARVIGVMSVQSYAANVYDEGDLDLLQILANHVAVAVENARLFAHQSASAKENQCLLNQISLRSDRLRVLNEVGMAVSQVLDMEALYEVVYQQTRRALKVDTFYIGIWDSEAELLSFPYEMDLDVRRRSPAIPLDDGLSSRAIRQKAPCVINNILAVSPPGERLLGAGPNSQSTIHVPMILGDRVLGVISVQSYDTDAYDEEDVRMLQTVAGQTAVALGNARLFAGQSAALDEIRRLNDQSEARASRMAVLNEVGVAVSRIQDLDSLYMVVYEQVGRVLPVEAFYIILWDEKAQKLVNGIDIDRGERLFFDEPQNLGNGPTSWVVRNRKPFVLSEETQSTQLNAATFGAPERCKSALHVPMILGDSVLGVVSAQSYSPNVYSDEDLQLLQAVATQTAVAVENARLFSAQSKALVEIGRLNEQNADRSDKLAVVNEIGMAVSCVLDAEKLYEAVYRETSRVLKSEAFLIGIWQASEKIITFPFMLDRGVRHPCSSMPLDDGPCSRVMRDGQTLLANSMEEVEALGGGSFGTNESCKSAIYVPMLLGERVMGVMSVQCYEADAYTAEDVQMMQTVALQTAVALANARLFASQKTALYENARLHAESARRADRLRVLNKAGVALSGVLDLDALHDVVYQQVGSIMSLDCFYIALWNPDADILSFTFYEHGKLPDRNVTLPVGGGPSGWVIRNRKPYLNQNTADTVQQAGSYYGNGPDAQSGVHVPLMLGDRIIGVMSAQSYSPAAYTEEDIQTLQTLAGQAAVAVENARLYRAVQDASLTDELTGLPNRRAVATRLEEELSRSARYGYSLCVLILDLDYFKYVNDTFGHPAGDDVLRELSLLLRGSLRAHDTLGRWGGEEFLVLLVHTDLEGGQVVAENLRKRVEAHPFLNGRLGRPLTVSIGGVGLEPPAHWEMATVVEAADSCLYQAKSAGRNRSVFPDR